MAPMNARESQVLIMQKGSMEYVKLNYNFVHDVLKKIGLDPNLLQENCRSWTIAAWEDHRGSGRKPEKTTKQKKEIGERTGNTEDDVNSKGERM